MVKMPDAEVAERLAAMPRWARRDDAIERTWEFPDFVHSMRFVQAVAAEAERVQHHPDITVRYSRVTLTLSTHDAAGISVKDFDFAAWTDANAPAAGARG